MRRAIVAVRPAEFGTLSGSGRARGSRPAAPRPDDQRDAGEQQRDRQQLSHCHAEDQEAELRVGLRNSSPDMRATA